MGTKGKWTCNIPCTRSAQSVRITYKLGGVYRAACLMAELNGALIRELIKNELIPDQEFSGITQNERGKSNLIQRVNSFSLPEYLTTPLIRALEIEISRWEKPFSEGGEGGFIPPRAWPLVLGAARLDGLVLSSEDLDPRLSPVRKPLPNIQKAYLHAHDMAPPPDDPEIREYIAGHYVTTTGNIYPIRKRGKRKFAPKL